MPKLDKSPILRVRLSRILKEKDVSAAAVSRAAGFDQTLIKNILYGRSRSPRTDTLDRLEACLGAPLGWLTARHEKNVESLVSLAVEVENLRKLAKAEKDKNAQRELLDQATFTADEVHSFHWSEFQDYVSSPAEARAAVQRLRSSEIFDPDAPPSDDYDFTANANPLTPVGAVNDPDEAYESPARQVFNDADVHRDKSIYPAKNRRRIAGLVGAGGCVIPLDSDNQLGFADIPFETPKDALALEVRGDSNAPNMDEGDLIIYRMNAPFILQDCINRRCVVQTEDGFVFVKKLKFGKTDGHFNLESTNAPTMEDIRIMWAGPVLGVVYR